MTSCVLTSALNLCILIMTNYKVCLLECMSYGNNFEILEELSNNLSHKTYDGEATYPWLGMQSAL